MKLAICAALALTSYVSFAGGFVSGESSFISFDKGGQQQLQVSISGPSAEALWVALTDVKGTDIVEEHTGSKIGDSKRGRNIDCTQMYGKTSCTIFADTFGSVYNL